jgi:hypothetical protein
MRVPPVAKLESIYSSAAPRSPPSADAWVVRWGGAVLGVGSLMIVSGPPWSPDGVNTENFKIGLDKSNGF